MMSAAGRGSDSIGSTPYPTSTVVCMDGVSKRILARANRVALLVSPGGGPKRVRSPPESLAVIAAPDLSAERVHPSPVGVSVVVSTDRRAHTLSTSKITFKRGLGPCQRRERNGDCQLPGLPMWVGSHIVVLGVFRFRIARSTLGTTGPRYPFSRLC